METADIALWRALQKLRSVAVWLMTGAHPDDEWSGFLAWLAFGRGVHTLYACATRGEGGQNALGPARGRLLGALRSREMERAAAVLDLEVHWLGTDDGIFDFGFSKSGDDTLSRWGEARLLERLVRLVRAERPDALSPTFLDVPGQHGHHQAVTRTTLAAAALAADPAFHIPGTEAAPWRVAKLYLPATPGSGSTYDDALPPPAETVRVDLGARCEALDTTWAQLGEDSRRHHASQGMGRILPPGARPFLLHLVDGNADTSLPLDGVPHSIADLADSIADGPAARALRDIDAAIATAIAAFPDRPTIATALHHALAGLDRLALPRGAEDIGRRLALKRRQLGRAAALALGIGATLTVPPLRVGQPCAATLHTTGPGHAALQLPPGWTGAAVPADAAPFGTLRDRFDPLGGDDIITATLHWHHAGSDASLAISPAERVTLAPAIEVHLATRAIIRRDTSPTPIPPDTHGAGLARLDASQGGPAAILDIARRRSLRAAIAINDAARVGVIAGEADDTLGWLRQLDIDAEPVDDITLATGDLSRFTTLLIGVLAFGQRPALHTHRARWMAWLAAGGNLVTLYHRPTDGWHAAPLPLTIGSPSLRWRVTDPAAPVTVLAPDHRLVTWPNAIAPADWTGWVRERGLYFARDWSPAYTPLLALADPGETPLAGALLAAPVGRGRHTHVALALHHQFAALVPGAFRLLANLVA